MSNLTELLKEWNEKPSNPLLRDHRTMDEAEVLIHALQVELAGKISVIELQNSATEDVINEIKARGQGNE